ncbi:MAG: hypothetical protein GY940_19090 [bacterium]|nr:hypothetical protein [bacterium]
MIFVTVGTHEDSFDRLVEAIDRLKGDGGIGHDVFIQTGYGTYVPQFCQYKDFIPYAEMMRRMEESEIVITHGGTGSIMLVLYHGKIPLVMPRQKRYNEHIDDHQVLFCKTMETRGKVIAAYETADLEAVVKDYTKRVQGLLPPDREGAGEGVTGDRLKQNAALFAQKLHEICKGLIKKKVEQTK